MAATGTVSSRRLRELHRVCEVATSSLTADTLLAGGEEGGNAGAPLGPALARKLLRVLDLLVDMEGRRSATLQISDAFGDVRVQV